jgi:hypothetical protein
MLTVFVQAYDIGDVRAVFGEVRNDRPDRLCCDG